MSSDHYFEPTPRVASRRARVELTLPDVHLRLATDRGVFSPDRIDTGTKVLLSEAPAPTESVRAALDLGCGYGAIACVLARRAPWAHVWAVDVNERARALTEENALANRCTNVSVAAPDAVPSDVRFDLVWSNPPIRIGKAALHSLLENWLTRLTPHGRAVLVVQRHLGADSLARWLAEIGYDVDRLASRQAYRVLEIHVSTT